VFLFSGLSLCLPCLGLGVAASAPVSSQLFPVFTALAVVPCPLPVPRKKCLDYITDVYVSLLCVSHCMYEIMIATTILCV